MAVGSKRVGSISWANANVLACGSKEKVVTICDQRQAKAVVERLGNGHSQEVCGVSFSENESVVASGGNDNRVGVWDLRGMRLQWLIREHKAAVRAIAWNPQASGVLASGGGNSDKTIKVFSTLTGTQLHNVSVDSQVCKLRFSRTTSELVSTHGYEHNLINVWDYPSMKKVGQLEGHQHRVLYLSSSPGRSSHPLSLSLDESTLLTGAGDETLKFWRVFPGLQSEKKCPLLSHVDLR